jgi:hypothetical protein
MHAAKLAALAVQQIAKVLDKLTEDQLADLAEGRAHVEFRSQDAVISSSRTRSSSARGSRTAPSRASVDIDGEVKAIKAMRTSAEVRAYLDANDKRLTLTVLKDLARALGPTVSATGSRKDVLKANIVEGTAGFRERSNAVFEGGWQS